MSLGFVITRHVNNKITDYYWKECYNCIRKFYDYPILIIDDNSNTEFLNENIVLKNCTVIYDKDHKGSGEFLAYYYFHKLKPFDTAVVIHDSIFIQSHINFELTEDEDIRFLWTFPHYFDDELLPLIDNISKDLVNRDQVMDLFFRKHQWSGCFGIMSIIRWDFLNQIDENHKIFDKLLPKITNRDTRHALERVFPLLAYSNDPYIKIQFGDIYSYIRWGVTFSEYLTQDFSKYPIVKVWSGR
jgi:hypothetical protein